MTITFRPIHNQTLNSIFAGKTEICLMTMTTNPVARVISKLESSKSPSEPQLATLIAAASAHSESPEILELLVDITSEAGTLKGRSLSTPAKDPLDDADKFTRPNGEIYYARPWGDDLDVNILRKAREHDKYVLFLGPPGTGKTALVEAAFSSENLLTVVGSGDTEVSDLVGTFVPNPDAAGAPYMWVDGPLVTAMEQGLPLLIDEIGLVDTKVLAALYGAIDGRRELVVTANPERGTVKAAEGFYLIGATNPNAPGVRLSEALLSRFVIQVEVTTDWALAGKMGVDRKIIQVSQNMYKKTAHEEVQWSPQFRELLAFRDNSKIFGYKFAVETLIRVCPPEDRETFREIIRLVTSDSYSAATI